MQSGPSFFRSWKPDYLFEMAILKWLFSRRRLQSVYITVYPQPAVKSKSLGCYFSLLTLQLHISSGDITAAEEGATLEILNYDRWMATRCRLPERPFLQALWDAWESRTKAMGIRTFYVCKLYVFKVCQHDVLGCIYKSEIIARVKAIILPIPVHG